MSKPEILIITPATVIGGGEIYLASLLPGLKQDYNVTVLAPHKVRRLVKDSAKTRRLILFPVVLEKLLKRNYRLKKIYYSVSFRLLFLGKAYGLINLEIFDGSIVESINKRPLVLTIQTRFQIPRHHDKYIKQVFKHIDHTICVSQQTKKDLRARGVPGSNSSVVHNGVSITQYEFISKPGENITWVGRVEKEDKNPLLFVKIAEESQTRGLSYKFRMVGDGSYLNEMRKYASVHQINNLEFSGFCNPSEMSKVYAKTRLLCMTSTSEGLPFVALEAMASGIPVVATAVGGLKELIASQKYGLLIDCFDEKIFVDNINALLMDNPRYEQVRLNARKRVEENFSVEVMIKKTKAVYDSLMELDG